MTAAPSLSARWRTALVSLVLFGAALLPRLPGLGQFLTTDEPFFLTAAGVNVITAFMRGDFRATYWHFYPGVTLSWLDALGLAGQYLLTAPAHSFTAFIRSDVLTLLVAVRLPYALLSAAAIPAIYLLARRLLPQRIAFLGALLLAFEPFFLAHSRVAHGDAPVTVFMALSALALFVLLSQRQTPSTGVVFKNPFLWISAIAGGLAALTKAPGQFMALFVVGLPFLYFGLTRPPAPRRWAAAGLIVLGWGLISLTTFVLLWPSMWVDPLGTLWQMLDETFFKVEAGHLVYFMGQPNLDPGFWFYPVVIPFRLSPLTLIGALLSILGFVPSLRRRTGLFPASGRPSPLFLLWLFVLSLWLFGTLSPKKQDRYLLPLFPFLDLLAAIGWVGLVALLSARFEPAARRLTTPIALLGLLILHLIPVFTYYPYYLVYFNPLLGGPQKAVSTTLIGWGEGMEQAAAYINQKPHAADLYVAAVPSQTFLPYFKGTGENFYTNDIAFRADYVVLYISQMQRLAPSPEIVRYFEAQTPEQIVTIHGLDYAKIYATPRRILPDIPPAATPANIGLGKQMRLAGTTIDPAAASLTLYWHALAPLPVDYTISVRALDAAGQRLAQQDQPPVDGLLPTSQWRQGDYVADTHILPNIPFNQIARFEVVVYHAQTGETLGQLSIVNGEW
jgi:4-amino-4-deoxy-L-arabinose transferase-like glycosyltransferase